ncbi:MAG: leucine-rich repeat domain-containing protein, partial [Lachnospiraceae bacterium]|nr:leucine-rich repeat domain-containing protein [Lachnospiraceae bacterium]
NNLKKIEVGLFQGCVSLTEIIIPNGVTEIEGTAFTVCDNLKKVTIPSSVTNIDYYAFDRDGGKGTCMLVTPKGSYAEQWAENRSRFEVVTE